MKVLFLFSLFFILGLSNVYGRGQVSVGPPYFPGKEPFTLTCKATDLDPPLKYTWSGVTCVKQEPGNTCTFTPDPQADDLRKVTCTAVSAKSGLRVSGTVQLLSAHPPTKKPVIQLRSTPRKDLWMGDRLTCTVTGGKPLVDSVHFYCVNPDLPDEDDEIKDTSVSSSVTVNAAHNDMSGGMICICYAIWKVKPEYYNLSTTVVIKIEHPPKAELVIEKQNEGRDYLRPGDSLTCTVKAGNPPVEFVDFSCLNPYLPDEDDIVSAISVASSVYLLSTPDDISKPTICKCHASMKILSESYNLTSSSEYHLKYPPPQKPEIQSEKNDIRKLQIGDKLTCTVTGGKPLVDSVYFYCTNPHLPDQTDDVSETSVTSSVIVTSAHRDYMTCFCNATWNIQPDYYQRSTTAVLHIEEPFKGELVIRANTEERDILTTGDTVTCTATGSRPLVDSVHFYCLNPDIPDGDDDITTTSVSSSVMVLNVSQSIDKMTCFCNGSWRISPGLFDLKATAMFLIQSSKRRGSWRIISGAVGGSFAFITIAVVFLGFICNRIFRKMDSAAQRISNVYEEVSELPIFQRQGGVPLPAISQRQPHVPYRPENRPLLEVGVPVPAISTEQAELPLTEHLQHSQLRGIPVQPISGGQHDPLSDPVQMAPRGQEQLSATTESPQDLHLPGVETPLNIDSPEYLLLLPERMQEKPDHQQSHAVVSPLTIARQQQLLQLLSQRLQDRVTPLLSEAGALMSAINQQQQKLMQLLSDPAEEKRQLPEAGVPISSNREEVPQELEELEKTALGATHPYEEPYTSLERTHGSEYYRYSDLLLSSTVDDV